MSKYYEAFQALEELIDNYVAIFSDDDQENVCRLKNIIVKGLQQRKKEHELLELYKKFVKTMQVDILIDEELEYLDIGGATDESIKLFKKIKELKEVK